MIYVSTGGFSGSTGYNSAVSLAESGLKNIELSGGAYDEDYLCNISSISNNVNFQIHNYFPPPKSPFVLNFASVDDSVTKLSMLHGKNAIELASSMGCKYCSFHAGFLVDPKMNELGQKFSLEGMVKRIHAKELFLERINQLAEIANKKDIKILIENNVLSQNNRSQNPFLMVDHEECLEIIHNTADNVGMLVDLAHLKVSSLTLGFCKYEFLETTKEYTFAYHLSDNDGLTDSNQPVREDSWFWNYLRKDLDYYSLEVYCVSNEILREQVDITEEALWN